MKKSITTQLLDKFLNGETTPEETVMILEQMAFDPSLQEYVITKQRLDYDLELHNDYSFFLPIRQMAADDGKNLCDFQCESYLLKKHGISFKDNLLAEQAKANYWLVSQGTPLYNVGKMLESYGLLVRRVFDACLQILSEALDKHDAIVVVNSMTLEGTEVDNPFSDDNPNHAVIVLAIDNQNGKVTLFNPSTGNESDIYDLKRFEQAWAESKNYLILVRAKEYEHEFIPQPIDVSGVSLSPDLLQLTDTIAENAHNVWAAEKIRKNPGIRYAPLNEDGTEKDGNYNHYLLPYSELPEEDKQPDIDMALNTIKLLKRLGYRIINMGELPRCPECGEPIEMNFLYCPHCGRRLIWEDFK